MQNLFSKRTKPLEYFDKIEQEILESDKGCADKVWVPKAFVIASVYPFFDYFRQILEDFWCKFDSPLGL